MRGADEVTSIVCLHCSQPAVPQGAAPELPGWWQAYHHLHVDARGCLGHLKMRVRGVDPKE